jgi:N-acetylmuramoyl-L-alanine amidase
VRLTLPTGSREIQHRHHRPGHGGHDRGGSSKAGSPEKVLALDTARRLAAILRSQGFRVLETRTRDVFVPLQARVKMSNSTQSCVFVSIHYNWTPRRGAGGIEIYYHSPRSWRLASNILQQTGPVSPTGNRGVKRNNFQVLRNNRRPAVLCELGFLSNPQDNRYAQSSRHRQRLAERVAAGILRERQSAER